MRARGADLIAFWREWPPGKGVCQDDAPFAENDHGALCTVDAYGNPVVPIDPATTYALDYGALAWQGEGPQPPAFDADLVRVFRRWLKARTVTTLVIEVLNDDVASARHLIESRGWKITHG